MRSNSSPPDTLQQGTGQSGQESRRGREAREGAAGRSVSKGQRQGHSQLHDEVEVAPTLIYVIQGNNVGVLDPEWRNEVVQS